MKKLTTITLLFLAISLNSQTITLSADAKNSIFGSEQTNFTPSPDIQLGVEWRENNISFGLQLESFEKIKYRDAFMLHLTGMPNETFITTSKSYQAKSTLPSYPNSYLLQSFDFGFFVQLFFHLSECNTRC